MGEGARSEGPTSTDNAGQTKLKLRRAANNSKYETIYCGMFVARLACSENAGTPRPSAHALSAES